MGCEQADWGAVIFGDSSNLGHLPLFPWSTSFLSLYEATSSQGFVLPCSHTAHSITRPQLSLGSALGTDSI